MLDLNKPFQRRLYLRQALLYGRAEDIRKLDEVLPTHWTN